MSFTSVKGSWSRVQNHRAVAATFDRIRRNERRKQKRATAALLQLHRAVSKASP